MSGPAAFAADPDELAGYRRVLAAIGERLGFRWGAVWARGLVCPAD
jgi:hypothetical protein